MRWRGARACGCRSSAKTPQLGEKLKHIEKSPGFGRDLVVRGSSALRRGAARGEM